MMQLSLLGVGLLASGLEGWEASREVLSNARAFHEGTVPDPTASILPPNERRRSSDNVRWAVHVAQEAMTQAGPDPRDVATVFASSGGEMGMLDRLCAALATTQRVVSPTLFHQSVHNTAAGYWGIATTCQQSSTALACHDDSFAAGLLEAASYVAVERRPVLLVACELPPPHPLYEARPIEVGFAVAMVLAPSQSPKSLAELTVSIASHQSGDLTTMPQERLERLRIVNPAARALPLLSIIASGNDGAVRLNSLDDQHVVVEVASCRC